MFPNLKNITYFDEAQTPFAQEPPLFYLQPIKWHFPWLVRIKQHRKSDKALARCHF